MRFFWVGPSCFTLARTFGLWGSRFVAGGVPVPASVVVAGYAIIASLDVQQVADFARAQVKAAAGRNLAIAGPVELKLLPTPSIQLQDLRFANADWGSRPELATIRRLEIERSEERRVGKEWFSTCRSRWCPDH